MIVIMHTKYINKRRHVHLANSHWPSAHLLSVCAVFCSRVNTGYVMGLQNNNKNQIIKWMRYVTFSCCLSKISTDQCEYGSYIASSSLYRDFQHRSPWLLAVVRLLFSISSLYICKLTDCWGCRQSSFPYFPHPTPPHPLFLRFEDHSWCTDPVGKEAVRRHDPHRFLPQCLCPHRPAALHGQPEAEVRAFSNQQQCHQQHQQHRRRRDVCRQFSAGAQLHGFVQQHGDAVQLDGVHQRQP